MKFVDRPKCFHGVIKTWSCYCSFGCDACHVVAHCQLCNANLRMSQIGIQQIKNNLESFQKDNILLYRKSPKDNYGTTAP